MLRLPLQIRRMCFSVLAVLSILAVREFSHPSSSSLYGCLQEQVDHFSDDERAMSPRSWGQPSTRPLSLPDVSFEQTERNSNRSRPNLPSAPF